MHLRSRSKPLTFLQINLAAAIVWLCSQLALAGGETTAPTILEPVVPGSLTVTIINLDPNASIVTLMQQDGPTWTIVPQSATTAVIDVEALESGAVLTATQTIDGTESAESEPVTVATPVPTLLGPIAPATSVVVVTGIRPEAEEVIVHDIDRAITFGSITPYGAGTIAIELDYSTAACQTLAATQIIAGSESSLSTTQITAELPSGHIVINEFRHDDNGLDDLEFIELYNADTVAIDISGWLLRQGGPSGDDDEPDYETLFDVILNPGEFYVLGAAGVSPDQELESDDFLSNDPASLELVTPCGEVIDTIAWARRNGVIAVTTEGWIWGDLYSYIPLHGESMSRWLDGLDSDNNADDFGVRRPTPGASNDSTITADFHMDLDALGSYSSQFFGQWRDALIIDPNQTGPIVDNVDWNPNPVDSPPGGGLAITFWDPDGGSNHYHSEALFDGAAFDVWMYFDTSTLLSGEQVFWTIGLRGSAVNDASNSDSGGLAGQTGVLWEYRRTASANKLTLFDAGTGGGRVAWDALGSLILSSGSTPPGWYRLGLSVDPNGAVVGIFDTEVFSAGTTSTALGSLHIVYDDENFGGQPQPRFRPPIIASDVDCDANGELDLSNIVRQQVEDCDGDFVPDSCNPPTLLPGDANYDGSIDGSDWLALEDCLTGPEASQPGYCCAASNLDSDQSIDCRDLALLQLAMGS
jgi:hypothetical protein